MLSDEFSAQVKKYGAELEIPGDTPEEIIENYLNKLESEEE